ncbi:methyltransferase [Desulforhopalus vacuolatus]|uniref:tRNA1(Val) (adenine(37)-N6)-methyltransferase n=1 Tax=Desulforhopalus vacuolatus TaxID=40414 RepID=UPI001962A41D|nr:methyltransferase [Desulforhopalus vacuolatus]MBM9519644.1 methyltransferase [Desulforhopalus vacuolatus]
MPSPEKSQRNKEYTEDTLFNGALLCRQHAAGYRFSVDSVLLAHFLDVKSGFSVFDLGSGCGVLPLILLYRNRDITCSGIELQPDLHHLATGNISAAGFTARSTIFNGDLRDIGHFAEAESVDRVISNPPFYPPGHGRASGGQEEEFARRQQNGGLAEFLAAARYLLKNRGSAVFIYPAEQGADFIVTAREEGMEVKNLRHVHSYPGGPAKLTLFSCMKNGRSSLKVLPPLYVYEHKGGPRSEEVKTCYRRN